MGTAAILTVGTTVLGAIGARNEGIAAQQSANNEAAQMQMKAQQERAFSQRSAMESRRQAELRVSRAQAVSAASGGAVHFISPRF